MVEGIVADVKKLVRQEMALAQHEVAHAWAKGQIAVALLAGALTVLGAAGVLLGFMLASLLQQYLLPNHAWACFGLAGGLVALLGGALIYFGLCRINEIHVSLPQTAEPLRADGQAAGAAASGGRYSTETFLKR
jgi:Putative Actinobacterial Holin-X, holin superfamily III